MEGEIEDIFNNVNHSHECQRWMLDKLTYLEEEETKKSLNEIKI